MSLPGFDSPLHADHVFTFSGIPVFENTLASHPLVLTVPIPGTSYDRTKLVVPDLKKFKDEIWIEQSLSTIVSREMGDTLEWLYGNRVWVSPSSRYSNLYLRVQAKNTTVGLQNAFRAIGKQMRDFARTTLLASNQVAGLSSLLPDSGSTATPDADSPST